MTTFEFVNKFLVLCKYLTCERLLSHHSLKTLKNMREGNISYRCLRFLHSKTSVLIVFLLCLLELLVVKNKVKLEKKTAYRKIKVSELFSGKT